MREFALRTKLEPPFGNHRLQTLGNHSTPPSRIPRSTTPPPPPMKNGERMVRDRNFHCSHQKKKGLRRYHRAETRKIRTRKRGKCSCLVVMSLALGDPPKLMGGALGAGQKAYVEKDYVLLRGPAILFISHDTCSDGIAELFRACF